MPSHPVSPWAIVLSAGASGWLQQGVHVTAAFGRQARPVQQVGREFDDNTTRFARCGGSHPAWSLATVSSAAAISLRRLDFELSGMGELSTSKG
jgi:hypothetical protein